MKLVGITQRLSVFPETGERRDSLALDWYPFLTALGVRWAALPNEMKAACELAETLGLQGLILSGGDDPGAYPERDATETALLAWFKARSLPVIGVCRGIQFICRCLGGELVPVNPDIHRARRHMVRFFDGSRREVNSYHNYGIRFDACTDGTSVTPLARCETDGTLESIRCDNVLAVMWHPEREITPHPDDLLLFRKHLGITG